MSFRFIALKLLVTKKLHCIQLYVIYITVQSIPALLAPLFMNYLVYTKRAPG